MAGNQGLLVPFILGVAHIGIIVGHVPSAGIAAAWQQGSSLQDFILIFLLAVGITRAAFGGRLSVDGDKEYAAYLAKINHETFRTIGWLGTGAGLVHLYQWYCFTRYENSFEKLFKAFGSTIQYQISETRFHLVNGAGQPTNAFDYPFADVVATMRELEVPMLLRFGSFVAAILYRRPAVLRTMTPKQVEFLHTCTTNMDNSFYLTLDLFVLRHTGRVTTYPMYFCIVHSCSLFASVWSGLLRVRPVMIQLASRFISVTAVSLLTGCWEMLLHPTNLVQSLTVVYLMLRAPWIDAHLRRNFARIPASQRQLSPRTGARNAVPNSQDSGTRRHS